MFLEEKILNDELL